MHAGSAGPVGGPTGGAGAYGPPWHMGFDGCCMHLGSLGPVGPGGGGGGWSGAGATEVPTKLGAAIAGAAAPVAATTMSAPAAAPFAIVARTPDAVVQLIDRSSCAASGRSLAPILLTPKNIGPCPPSDGGGTGRTLIHRTSFNSGSEETAAPGTPEHHRGLVRIRMGPRQAASGSRTSPFWVTTMSPTRASSRATSWASLMRSRQFSLSTARAASEGQMVFSGPRSRASSRILSRSRGLLTAPSEAESGDPCHQIWNTF
jgi:hypothetical protein